MQQSHHRLMLMSALCFGPGAAPVAPSDATQRGEWMKPNRRSVHSSNSCHATSASAWTAPAGIKDKAKHCRRLRHSVHGVIHQGAFGTSHSRERALRRVLRAYAMRRPAVGYCQGLNLLGACLLMTTDGDVDAAFWLLSGLVRGPVAGIS